MFSSTKSYSSISRVFFKSSNFAPIYHKYLLFQEKDKVEFSAYKFTPLICFSFLDKRSRLFFAWSNIISTTLISSKYTTILNEIVCNSSLTLNCKYFIRVWSNCSSNLHPVMAYVLKKY